MSAPVHQGRISKQGFSLIELLSVMAILSMMAVAAVPALNTIKGGNSISKAATDISGVLEQARSYAMANNTYVFVGITEVNASNEQPGTGKIIVVAAGSRDGTRSFGTGNSNLVALARPWKFESVHLNASSPNSGNMSRPVVSSSYQVADSAFAAESSFQWPLSGGTANFTFTKIIQFDPRGTASIQSSSRSLPQWLEIGLSQARGDTAVESADRAALQLDGVTGSVNIYQP